MPYAEIADLYAAASERELIAATDDEGLGAVHQDRALRALADASDEIDGYLGARYALPLAETPPILRKLCVDLAVHNLFSRRAHGPSESRESRRQSAVRFLEQVAKGAISLGADDPEAPPKSDAPEFSAANPVRIFGRKDMGDF